MWVQGDDRIYRYHKTPNLWAEVQQTSLRTRFHWKAYSHGRLIKVSKPYIQLPACKKAAVAFLNRECFADASSD